LRWIRPPEQSRASTVEREAALADNAASKRARGQPAGPMAVLVQATAWPERKAINHNAPADLGRAPAETQLLFKHFAGSADQGDHHQAHSTRSCWPATGPKSNPKVRSGMARRARPGHHRPTETSHQSPLPPQAGGRGLLTESLAPRAGTRRCGQPQSSGSGADALISALKTGGVGAGKPLANCRGW